MNALPQPSHSHAPPQAGGWSSLQVAAARLLPGNPLPQFAWLSRGTNGADQLWWAEFTAASPGAPPVASATHFKSLSGMDSETEVVEFADCRRLCWRRSDGH
jgi:hypothetical protein